MRYHFHIRDGHTLIVDHEGAEYLDLAAARLDAIRSARELLSEVLARGDVLNGRAIEICDQHGTIMEIVRLRDQIRLL